MLPQAAEHALMIYVTAVGAKLGRDGVAPSAWCALVWSISHLAVGITDADVPAPPWEVINPRTTKEPINAGTPSGRAMLASMVPGGGVLTPNPLHAGMVANAERMKAGKP